MKKTISLLFLFIFLLSCGRSNKKQDETSNEQSQLSLEETEVIPSPVKPARALPNEAYTFDTNLILVNFGRSQEHKVLKAAELIRAVVATSEFRRAVINHTYNGKKTFVDNNGLTNTQIYNRILQGAEKLLPKRNNAMDVELKLYKADNQVIGYTYPNTTMIWMNTKFFNVYTAPQVAGNLMHEWLHKLGFGHATKKTPSRPYSVPYAIGYIIERLTKKHQ
jgi:hypothetical protein